ncbi:MAG: transcription termination/antitermination protein NusG [Candidatus Polarisedimenticolia bacterium]
MELIAHDAFAVVAPEAAGAPAPPGPGAAGGGAWRVLWTRSHCEQLVHDQLVSRGFRPFLPRMSVWARRGRLPYLSRVPVFPGYLFLDHPLDKRAYVEVRRARGLVGILGQGWDRPATVPDPEIEAIRALSDAAVPAFSHPFLKEGTRVRVVQGPLAGVEGILARGRPERGLVVLSVNLLRRSVAVEIDCTAVVPA